MRTKRRDTSCSRCRLKAQPYVRVAEWLSAQFDRTGEHPIICRSELRDLLPGPESGQQFRIYRHPPLRLTCFDRPDSLTHDSSCYLDRAVEIPTSQLRALLLAS